MVSSEPVRAVLRSGELAQVMSRMRPEFIAVLPELFRFEPYIQADHTSMSPDGEWEWRIKRNIFDYKDADSLDAYVTKTCELVSKSNQPTIYSSGPSLDSIVSSHFNNSPIVGQVGVEVGTTDAQPTETPSGETRGAYVKEAIITELEDLDGAA